MFHLSELTVEMQKCIEMTVKTLYRNVNTNSQREVCIVCLCLEFVMTSANAHSYKRTHRFFFSLATANTQAHEHKHQTLANDVFNDRTWQLVHRCKKSDCVIVCWNINGNTNDFACDNMKSNAIDDKLLSVADVAIVSRGKSVLEFKREKKY